MSEADAVRRTAQEAGEELYKRTENYEIGQILDRFPSLVPRLGTILKQHPEITIDPPKLIKGALFIPTNMPKGLGSSEFSEIELDVRSSHAPEAGFAGARFFPTDSDWLDAFSSAFIQRAIETEIIKNPAPEAEHPDLTALRALEHLSFRFAHI